MDSIESKKKMDKVYYINYIMICTRRHIMDKKLFTVNEAWEALGHTMSKAYLYKLIKLRQIPAIQIGSRKLIKGGWIKKVLNSAEETEVERR